MKEINNAILNKEQNVFGTNPIESQNCQDFRALVAITNHDPSYLEPSEFSKASLGNLYSLWLASYIDQPGISELPLKAVLNIIDGYDFHTDETNASDNQTFQQYLKHEISTDDLQTILK